MSKCDSHKGKNKKENFIVQFYYNNFFFFAMEVVCSEIAAVFLVILKRSHTAKNNDLFIIAVVYTTCCLAIKMFINVHQWRGACERLAEQDAAINAGKKSVSAKWVRKFLNFWKSY